MAYIRKYELIIGSPSHTYTVTTPKKFVGPEIDSNDPTSQLLVANQTRLEAATPAPGQYTDFRTVPAGDKAISISSLHIEADITYSSNKTSSNNQTSTIRIFNARPETQKFIKQNGVLFLKAGFETQDPYSEETQTEGGLQSQERNNDIPLIFIGQIEKVRTEKEGQDTITTIVCKDLGFDIRSVRVSQGFPKGTSYRYIVKKLLSLAAKEGMPTGYFAEPDGNQVDRMEGKAPSGFVVEGNLVEQLNTICSDLGYRAYISLGKIYVEPVNRKIRYETVVLKPINIKGQVRREESSEGDGVDGPNEVIGIRVNTFLNGSIASNKMLKIEEGQYAGLYKIESVSHSLSYEGDVWDTEIVATEVG